MREGDGLHFVLIMREVSPVGVLIVFAFIAQITDGSQKSCIFAI